MVPPRYAGPFEGRVDYQVNRALAHSAAGQRRQKIKNEGDDDQFGFKTPGFSPYLNRDQANLNALHIFIYTLLNAFAKALMLIL